MVYSPRSLEIRERINMDKKCSNTFPILRKWPYDFSTNPSSRISCSIEETLRMNRHLRPYMFMIHIEIQKIGRTRFVLRSEDESRGNPDANKPTNDSH